MTTELLAIVTNVGLESARSGAQYSQAPLGSVIGVILRSVLGLLGVIFLVLTIYAGFTWMTAGGDEKKVTTAKNILIRATIGAVICISAYGITDFVIGALEQARSSLP